MTASFRAISTTEPSFVSSFNCAKPAGTAQDDVLLACAAVSLATAAAVGTPTGGATWTLLDSLDGGSGSLHTKIWWKVAGGSEPANYAFTMSSSSDASVAVLAIQGAGSDAPLHANSTAGSGVNVVTPTLTPNAADDLEVRIAAAADFVDSISWTPPSTYTQRANLGFLGIATKELSSGSATGALNYVASTTPTVRHGFTIDVATLVIPTIRRPPVMSTAAVRRSTSW